MTPQERREEALQIVLHNRIRIEWALVTLSFVLAAHTLIVGLQHRDYVGWTESGVISMIGLFLCAGLIWQRRKTDRNSIYAILFVNLLSNLVFHGMKWKAGEREAVFPFAELLLTASVLVLIVWENRIDRRSAMQAFIGETKEFEIGP